MPEWLTVASTAVAAAFTVGTVVRGVATWVWTNTIKRDLSRLSERIDELRTEFDNYDGSDLWSDVQTKVGSIEVDQRLLKQDFGHLSKEVERISQEFNAQQRDRRYRNDDRRGS